ncbi:helix-turn-helix domain-containing protein [Staphylococcus aureus]|uniref:helix-turn-helix domain-containing protein n=1 Tax=Staphylococcus aureus TaxID=1280 RepID=UPI0013FB041B|nr:helix-turn-helix transcriptional regulator [Staphylococcus aureus]MBF2706240.1 helix-turn-helix transcriptional regulator [Staphylococcus aureus]MBF2722794.1 helix-turn-helix transcriptional regulator [Staphylococcus aureus]MBU6092604.1 helix-turn-helix domain-containing protein [Staphylococcus aureus]MBU6935485.1 helix-turn-helix domain-containing protein [Staphylococcus aureus]MBU7224573.1 helix-turn-helix domain-containing protein [Staphylococcus aureus]
MNIGDNIKKIRKEKNITQSELAKSLEISQSYLSDLENNRKNLGINTVEKIAKKLNVTIGYLTSGNKMLGDLTEKEEEEEFFKLNKKMTETKNKRERLLKENLFNLLKKDLSIIELQYFNNFYNFYELEKNNNDVLIFMAVLIQWLNKHKASKNTEAYDDIINEFDSFLKRYLNIK